MIESKQNERVKKIRSLFNKKFRTEYSLFVAEGVKPVSEALISNAGVVTVFGTEKALLEVESLGASFSGVEVLTVTDAVYKSVSDEVSPQGVLAVIKMPDLSPVKTEGKCLLLDGVSDPGNMGTIIRTAAASGFNQIYCINTVDPFAPKTVRSSMSGIFKVKIYSGERQEILKSIDTPLIVASMEGVNAFSFTSPEKFCLVIGNEANGVSDFVKNKADYTVSIPMQNGVESLNAGVSAGILMYLLGVK
ncbi:MAG: RNA methyltransferase [Clostridia bacterium]|nr:RNA methyltransferase [Clostridia bacterium]